MEVSIELKPMFSYLFSPIALLTILLVFIFLLTKHPTKNKLPKDIIIPTPQDLTLIKNNYLLKLQKLTNDFNEKKISNRQAYQSLSNIIRNFIYETTNIKVQNYTLKDISTINLPILYELVSEYYDPEFSKISQGNITASIAKTRMVIEKWN